MSSILVLARGKIPPPTITSYIAGDSVQVGYSYTSTSPTVTGGLAPFTYSSPFDLPSGLTLNSSTGVISGTPTGANGESISGTLFGCRLTVTDASGLSSNWDFNFAVFSAPVIRVVNRSQPGSGGNSVGVGFNRNGTDLFPNIVLGPAVEGWAHPSVGYTNTIGDLYEARVASVTGGITGLNGRTVGTWYAIDGTSANFSRLPLGASGVMNLEIRRKSDGIVVATGTFTYS